MYVRTWCTGPEMTYIHTYVRTYSKEGKVLLVHWVNYPSWPVFPDGWHRHASTCKRVSWGLAWQVAGPHIPSPHCSPSLCSSDAPKYPEILNKPDTIMYMLSLEVITFKHLQKTEGMQLMIELNVDTMKSGNLLCPNAIRNTCRIFL